MSIYIWKLEINLCKKWSRKREKLFHGTQIKRWKSHANNIFFDYYSLCVKFSFFFAVFVRCFFLCFSTFSVRFQSQLKKNVCSINTHTLIWLNSSAACPILDIVYVPGVLLWHWLIFAAFNMLKRQANNVGDKVDQTIKQWSTRFYTRHNPRIHFICE